MPELRVLVVEDDPVAAEAHRTYVERLPGFTCLGVAGTAARALQVLARGDVDLVLLDMHLPDATGLDVFRDVRRLDRRTPVVFITGSAGTDTAIEAMKEGAF
ncbi:MAG TPA: response regulator, partial [Kribbella sp.]|nr:response regulator [Kribbella sp.]